MNAYQSTNPQIPQTPLWFPAATPTINDAPTRQRPPIYVASLMQQPQFPHLIRVYIRVHRYLITFLVIHHLTGATPQPNPIDHHPNATQMRNVHARTPIRTCARMTSQRPLPLRVPCGRYDYNVPNALRALQRITCPPMRQLQCAQQRITCPRQLQCARIALRAHQRANYKVPNNALRAQRFTLCPKQCARLLQCNANE